MKKLMKTLAFLASLGIFALVVLNPKKTKEMATNVGAFLVVAIVFILINFSFKEFKMENWLANIVTIAGFILLLCWYFSPQLLAVAEPVGNAVQPAAESVGTAAKAANDAAKISPFTMTIIVIIAFFAGRLSKKNK